MTEFFLDVWTFAFSQIGLVAIGLLLGAWLGRRGHSVVVLDEQDLDDLLDDGEVVAEQ